MPSGGSKDNSAEIARKEEAARQARIKQGVTNIDSAFSGYDDDFYNNYKDTYLNYYNPQLQDQYSDAVKKLTLQLAQTGNLTGKVGADQLSDLKSYYDTQGLSLSNQALAAMNTLKSNVETKKSDLYTQNRSAADPGSATTTATAAAEYLQPTTPTSPLANVFSDFFSQLGNTAAIANASSLRGGSGVTSYNTGTGKSTYVV